MENTKLQFLPNFLIMITQETGERRQTDPNKMNVFYLSRIVILYQNGDIV